MKNLFILVVFISASFFAFGRPLPQKHTAEVLNDVYRDANNEPTASLDVTLTATAFSTSETPQEIKEGATVDFTVNNISDASFYDVLTLAENIKSASFVNNSGGAFILRIDAGDVGYIAPGQESSIPLAASAGSVIRIQSVSGTVNTGNIYLNVFGDQ